MAFLNAEQLGAMGFRSVGENVLISDRASIYEPEKMSFGDNARVDDFCVLSGEISLGRNVHLAVFSNVASGRSNITLDDFAGLAYGCHLIAQSDDYSGTTMSNATVPREFKNETSEPIHIGRHALLGTGTIVLPGVTVGEGTATAARTVLSASTREWMIYAGSPGRPANERSRALPTLEDEYLKAD